MKKAEKDNKVYQIYAVLGELSVHKKQSEQRLAQINAQIADFEKQYVDLLAVEVEAEEEAEKLEVVE